MAGPTFWEALLVDIGLGVVPAIYAYYFSGPLTGSGRSAFERHFGGS